MPPPCHPRPERSSYALGSTACLCLEAHSSFPLSANVPALGKTTICAIFKNIINPNFVLQAKSRAIVHPSPLLTSFVSFRCSVSSYRCPPNPAFSVEGARRASQLLGAECGVHSCSPSAQQAEQKDHEFQDSLGYGDKPCRGLGVEGSVVQLVECLHHTRETLGLVLQHCTDGITLL